MQNFICYCTDNYVGTFCDGNLDCSDVFPCKNGGTCLRNQCFCTLNWSGTRCDVKRTFLFNYLNLLELL